MRRQQISKRLIERDFLQERDAEALQNCVEAGVQLQPLLDDCDQNVDRVTAIRIWTAVGLTPHLEL